MISILIPAKDYDCHKLIEQLHRQGETCGIPYEILIGEDGTAANNLQFNECCDRLDNCRRIIKERNVGRSKIRNILAKEAQYPYIIFIDCDAVVEKEDFLNNYIAALKENKVVCGGLYHAKGLSDKTCSLRYTYEKQADKLRNAETRNKKPYEKFSTFNFGIHRDLFLSIMFDESISLYGYEDTLFGKELERGKHKIHHIENRLLHSGIDNNATFLAKSEQALQTLVSIKEKIGATPLLEAEKKLKRLHLEWLFMVYWKICKNRMRRNLLGAKPSLITFSIYKLGYYISLCRKSEQQHKATL